MTVTSAHHRRLVQVATAMCGDEVLAADLTQDALVRAFQAFASFRDGASPYPWLVTILRNVYRDHMRSACVRHELQMAAPEEQTTYSSVNPSALERVLDSERLEALRAAVNDLSGELATTLTLVDIQGLSYEESADAMQVPVGTVRSRLSRARASLRDKLLAAAQREARASGDGEKARAKAREALHTSQ